MKLFTSSCDTECTVWMHFFAGDFYLQSKIMLPVSDPNYTPIS